MFSLLEEGGSGCIVLWSHIDTPSWLLVYPAVISCKLIQCSIRLLLNNCITQRVYSVREPTGPLGRCQPDFPSAYKSR